MRKLSKIISSILLISLLMVEAIASTASAAEVNPATPSSVSQATKINLPNLESMQKITRGQEIKITSDKDQFYKMDLKGETYVIVTKGVASTERPCTEVQGFTIATGSRDYG